MTSIRGFKPVFMGIGVIYILMASSMLVRGPAVLLEFGIPESVVSGPVLQDIFLFFYQEMAFVGLLMVLFGHVTRERNAQLLVSSVFCIAYVLSAWHDLSTSDSQLGNHLYKGEKTLVFVYIGLAIAAAFGSLAVIGFTKRRDAFERDPG